MTNPELSVTVDVRYEPPIISARPPMSAVQRSIVSPLIDGARVHDTDRLSNIYPEPRMGATALDNAKVLVPIGTDIYRTLGGQGLGGFNLLGLSDAERLQLADSL
ncbi:MAG: hypothetical protein WDN66_04810 [Candidatus Saccharibacteria bacterium]